jgi:hypothetical protein
MGSDPPDASSSSTSSSSSSSSSSPSSVLAALASNDEAQAAGVAESLDLQAAELVGAAIRGPRDPEPLHAASLAREAWHRLVPDEHPAPRGVRERGLALAGSAVRRALVAAARRRETEAPKGAPLQVLLDSRRPPTGRALARGPVLAVEGTLAHLERSRPRIGRVASLHLVAGLSLVECSALLGESLTDVEAEWDVARRFLLDAL